MKANEANISLCGGVVKIYYINHKTKRIKMRIFVSPNKEKIQLIGQKLFETASNYLLDEGIIELGKINWNANWMMVPTLNELDNL